MKYLDIKTEKKGNEPKYKENFSCVTTFLRHSEDRITIDDFEGFGKAFKQREVTEIKVYQNGKLLFSGDKYEFFEKLKS